MLKIKDSVLNLNGKPSDIARLIADVAVKISDSTINITLEHEEPKDIPTTTVCMTGSMAPIAHLYNPIPVVKLDQEDEEEDDEEEEDIEELDEDVDEAADDENKPLFPVLRDESQFALNHEHPIPRAVSDTKHVDPNTGEGYYRW
jgi:hypothetical protein